MVGGCRPFVDNDGLRIEVLFSGNGVRAVSSQWATQGRVLHNGSLSLRRLRVRR